MEGSAVSGVCVRIPPRTSNRPPAVIGRWAIKVRGSRGNGYLLMSEPSSTRPLP